TAAGAGVAAGIATGAVGIAGTGVITGAAGISVAAGVTELPGSGTVLEGAAAGFSLRQKGPTCELCAIPSVLCCTALSCAQADCAATKPPSINREPRAKFRRFLYVLAIKLKPKIYIYSAIDCTSFIILCAGI